MSSDTNDQSQKKITVLTGGCFDLLHFGHISFLEKAKALGTYLIVALESDENVRYAKGPSRPIHTQKQRKHMLSALSCIDEVIELPPMKTDAEYNDLVIRIRPNIIAVTQGDPIKTKKENQAVAIGGILVEIPKIHTPSTSQLAKLLELELQQ
jgi:rfaE bifunctional protein nucleotidyltransferase chain/domain